MEPFVCFLRASQAGEHSHRPEPTPVHGGLNPSGEGIDARETDIPGIINVFYIVRGIETFDLQIGDGGKTWKAFRGFTENLRLIFYPFLFLLFDSFEPILFEHFDPPLI